MSFDVEGRSKIPLEFLRLTPCELRPDCRARTNARRDSTRSNPLLPERRRPQRGTKLFLSIRGEFHPRSIHASGAAGRGEPRREGGGLGRARERGSGRSPMELFVQRLSESRYAAMTNEERGKRRWSTYDTRGNPSRSATTSRHYARARIGTHAVHTRYPQHHNRDCQSTSFARAGCRFARRRGARARARAEASLERHALYVCIYLRQPLFQRNIELSVSRENRLCGLPWKP